MYRSIQEDLVCSKCHLMYSEIKGDDIVCKQCHLVYVGIQRDIACRQ